MNDLSHPERDSYIEWYGSVFNPIKVSLSKINKDLAKLDHYISAMETDNE